MKFSNKCQNRKRCSRVLYLQEVSDLQFATSSSIAITFEELNDEGSDTTVFRAWNTVSTSLHDQTTHRQTVDLGGSDLDDTMISCMVYFKSWFSERLLMATKRTRSRHGQ